MRTPPTEPPKKPLPAVWSQTREGRILRQGTREWRFLNSGRVEMYDCGSLTYVEDGPLTVVVEKDVDGRRIAHRSLEWPDGAVDYLEYPLTPSNKNGGAS